MDKLVKGRKRNVENASEGTHSNKLSISGEERAGFTFGLPRHSLEDVQAKKKHP